MVGSLNKAASGSEEGNKFNDPALADSFETPAPLGQQVVSEEVKEPGEISAD